MSTTDHMIDQTWCDAGETSEGGGGGRRYRSGAAGLGRGDRIEDSSAGILNTKPLKPETWTLSPQPSTLTPRSGHNHALTTRSEAGNASEGAGGG